VVVFLLTEDGWTMSYILVVDIVLLEKETFTECAGDLSFGGESFGAGFFDLSTTAYVYDTFLVSVISDAGEEALEV
jgi:hypothetical protein